MPNGIAYFISTISNRLGCWVGGIFSFFQVVKANSADPDQTPHYVLFAWFAGASGLGLIRT